MTTLQMNVEFYRAMSEIADDETLLEKAVKYVKKLATKKRTDPTLLTKEEFYAKLDRAEKQIAEGKGMKMLPNEDLTTFLRRNGYNV